MELKCEVSRGLILHPHLSHAFLLVVLGFIFPALYVSLVLIFDWRTYQFFSKGVLFLGSCNSNLDDKRVRAVLGRIELTLVKQFNGTAGVF
jgi:hypothetical protein